MKTRIRSTLPPAATALALFLAPGSAPAQIADRLIFYAGNTNLTPPRTSSTASTASSTCWDPPP